METRKLSWFFAATVLVLFLSGTLPGAIASPFKPSSAQVATISPPSFLEIGFGPSSLSYLTEGIPVFTANDNLWVATNLSQPSSFILMSPEGIQVASVYLSPFSAAQLYTFATSDQGGNYELTISLFNSSVYRLFIPVSIQTTGLASARLAEYSIQNGQINLGFVVDPAGAYNLEGCLTSNVANGTIKVQEPSSVGSGSVSIAIEPNSSTSNISIAQKPSQPFTFWYEMYYLYAYAGGAPNGTISRELQTLTSDTALFSGNLSEVVSLNTETALRPGRYSVRAYFDTSSGLTLGPQTEALLQNDGEWFWLSACDPFAITQTSFSDQVSLSENPGTWPSELYFMYDQGGIDGYSIVSLQINLARIDFFGGPGNVRLSYLSYSIANNTDLQASGVYDGSVYVIAKTFPLSLGITPLVGSLPLSPHTVEIASPFTDSQVTIPIGIVNVDVTNNSKPDTGIQIGISNGFGLNLSSIAGAHGNSSFYVPSGKYNVTVAVAGIHEVQPTNVTNGHETDLTFAFVTTSTPEYLPELLLIPLALGVILNIWVWMIRPKRPTFILRK